MNDTGGDRAGNGGDVLVCTGTNISENKVIFLDSYEALERGNPIVLEGASIEKKVTNALNKYAKLDIAGRYEMMTIISRLLKDVSVYEHTKRTLLTDTFFSNDELTDVQDSLELSLPPGCFIKQLILYKTVKFSKDRSFFISRKYWDQLSEDDKATAIIHEALYVYYFKRGWSDSRFARYMNYIINTSEYLNYGISDFLNDAYVSQKNKGSFLYLPSFSNSNNFPNYFSLVKMKNPKERSACTTGITPYYEEDRVCLEIELGDSLSNIGNNPVHNKFQWKGFTLIPFKAAVIGKEVVGYEAVVTTRKMIDHSRHDISDNYQYVPIQHFTLANNQTSRNLSWKYSTLSDIFDGVSSVPFRTYDYPIVFINMNGVVEYIYNESHALNL
jgi:hypothetical protein